VAGSAPGRVNLIGEHTDYNDGFVLPLAIPREVRVHAADRDDRVLRVASAQSDGPPVEIDARRRWRRARVDGWAAYVAGTAWALQEHGVALAAPTCSSTATCRAAPACHRRQRSSAPPPGPCSRWPASTCRSPRWRCSRSAPRTTSSACRAASWTSSPRPTASAGHLLLLDTRTLEPRHIPFDLEAEGLRLVVIDTRAPHRLVDGEYAARRASCEQAAVLLGVPALRDVDDLGSAMSRLDDDVLQRRVRHVVTENQRVLDVVALLEAGDVRGIGPLLTASHESLRDDYEVSSPELDVAVDAALRAGAHGARMTGGGFGGSAIALVESSTSAEVRSAVLAAFAAAGMAEPGFVEALPSTGAARVL
jgi:galactokinase